MQEFFLINHIDYHAWYFDSITTRTFTISFQLIFLNVHEKKNRLGYETGINF